MSVQDADARGRGFAKAASRLVPFLVFLYFISFLDRVNVGFAALTMNRDLGLSAEAFGFGAGIFFVAYAILEVPSNIILERVGARRWIFRIMLSWGLVSAATAFVYDETSFYVLRFLLGVAEAGFFPGLIFYLTCWFPADMRARMIAGFMVAVPLAGLIGSPLSGAILGMDGVAGLTGWKWLFLLEGIPAVVMAFVVLRVLPDKPADAPWLLAEEQAAMVAHLASEPPPDHRDLWPALRDPRVWILIVPYFGIVLALYGLNFWLPQIVKGMGFSNLQTGFVVALPYVAAAGAMYLWGWRSDRSGERIGHFTGAAVLVAVGFAGAGLFSGDFAIFMALTLATVGIYAAFGPFWSIPAGFLRGPAAAGGIALINSIGNLGGFAGPYLIGWVKQTTGAYTAAMEVLAVVALLAALAMMLVGRRNAARVNESSAPQ